MSFRIARGRLQARAFFRPGGQAIASVAVAFWLTGIAWAGQATDPAPPTSALDHAAQNARTADANAAQAPESHLTQEKPAGANANAPLAPSGNGLLPTPASLAPLPETSVLLAHPFALPTFAALPHRFGVDANALVLSEAAGRRQRAERLIRTRDFAQAQAEIATDATPAGALLRARIAIGTGNEQAAKAQVAAAAADSNLNAYVALERGRLALVAGQPAEAVAHLMPLFHAGHLWSPQAALPLASALAESEPERLLSLRSKISDRLPSNNPSGQSLLQELVVAAERKLGRTQQACESEIARFVDWPVAKETPSSPPSCRPLTADEWLLRIEHLVDANRNEAARAAFAAMRQATSDPLSTTLSCKSNFLEGMVARKRRRYAEAEAALGTAASLCADADITRRALYTQTKVVSIQDGLRALAPIEAFAKRYGTHSMVDDVLFWAGDSLQRRGRDEEAAHYYKRILALPRADDHCVEASWRLSWMAYRKNNLKRAKEQLHSSLQGHCQAEPWTKARARYWLGRIAEATHKKTEAIAHYQAAMAQAPLHFYAQQSLSRLSPLLAVTKRKAVMTAMAPPKIKRVHAPCMGPLAAYPETAEGLYLLRLGLLDEARAAFLSVDRNFGPVPIASSSIAKADTRPKSHVKNPRLAAKVASAINSQAQAQSLSQCGSPKQAALALCVLLERSGAHKESRARLSRDFASELARFPTAETLPIWQEAYPLAYREPLSRAEHESRLPPFLLQSLAREESGFDAEVISWAEAVGLTQLLLSSGQQAGRSLSPPVSVASIEELQEPHMNARLGGALLGLFGHQLADSWPLALAAYNGGYDVAKTWWRRHGGDEFSTFAEEMTIKETRMYVQRVLQTFGIYRWLYASAAPTLNTESKLPSCRN